MPCSWQLHIAATALLYFVASCTVDAPARNKVAAVDVTADGAASDSPDAVSGTQDAMDGDDDAIPASQDAIYEPQDVTGPAKDGAVSQGPDTALSDTAVSDTAVSDTAVSDTAVSDTAVSDAAVSDTNDATSSASDDSSMAAGDAIVPQPDGVDAADAPAPVDATTQLDAGQPSDITAGTVADGAATQDSGGSDVAQVTPIAPQSMPLAGFTDVTKAYGFNTKAAYTACVAAGDLDGSGGQDVVVVQSKAGTVKIDAALFGTQPPKHVLSPVNVATLNPNMGCTLADINDDGHLDLLLGGTSGIGLYVGDGKGAFIEQTTKWMPYIMDFAAWSIQPADLDGDGDLDLYIGAGRTVPSMSATVNICSLITCTWTAHDFQCHFGQPPPALASNQDRVLIRSASGVLVDATKAWGVPAGGQMTAVAAVDLDEDGDVDIVVADDFGPMRLLRSTATQFEAHGVSVGFPAYLHAMGVGVGDFNDDGRADIVVADLGPSLAFQQVKLAAAATPTFQDISADMGLAAASWGSAGWSPIIADFDQDGRDDLLLGSGHNIDPKWLSTLSECKFSSIPQNIYQAINSADLLFLSSGKGTPVGKLGYGVSRVASAADWNVIAQGQVAVDIDGDGDLDLVQSKPSQDMQVNHVRVLRNDLPGKGGYVRVRLTGRPGNRFAVGAVVRGKAGTVLRTRWLTGSAGFGGAPLAEAHFGLGSAAALTSVTVRWPDGKISKLGNLQQGSVTDAAWPTK